MTTNSKAKLVCDIQVGIAQTSRNQEEKRRRKDAGTQYVPEPIPLRLRPKPERPLRRPARRLLEKQRQQRISSMTSNIVTMICRPRVQQRSEGGTGKKTYGNDDGDNGLEYARNGRDDGVDGTADGRKNGALKSRVGQHPSE